MIFTQNTKLKASSTNGWTIFGFGLEPVRTCPFAGSCRRICYARKGLYRTHLKACKARWDSNLALTKRPEGFTIIGDEISRLERNAIRRSKRLAIRIHTEGDFYDISYACSWIETARRFPNVLFYAYTKSHKMLSSIHHIPANLNIIASEGGKHDALLSSWSGPVARVVDEYSGFNLQGSDDDKVAMLAKSGVVEIIKH